MNVGATIMNRTFPKRNGLPDFARPQRGRSCRRNRIDELLVRVDVGWTIIFVRTVKPARNVFDSIARSIAAGNSSATPRQQRIYDCCQHRRFRAHFDERFIGRTGICTLATVPNSFTFQK